MRRLITKILMLIVLALLVVPLAACERETIYVADKRSNTQGGGGRTQSKTNQTTEEVTGGDGTTYNLTIWCAEEDEAMIREMLNDYEGVYSSNHYNWKVETQGEDVVSSTVIRDVSAAADVFSFANDQLGTLLNNDALTQIPSKYNAQIEAQIDVARLAASYESKYYAIPYSYENCFLYYNKSLITNVSSLEGILNASLSGVEYNLGIDMSDSYYTTMFLYTAGVTIFGEQGTDPNDVNLNNANAYKACKYIQSLSSKTKLGSIAKADQYGALQNGKVAAMISGPHMISQFKQALGNNFAVAMLPTIRFEGESKDTQLVSFSGVKLYGVSKKSTDVRSDKATEEALRVAAYLANQKNQQRRLEDREFCPTDATLFEDALSSGIKTVETVVAQSEYSKLKPGIIQMSSYWDNMKGFLLGVYKLTYGEADWANELKKIENKLKS
ncbi:MAG: extracellular solute-binding protein [Gammaproteobacteria bacterium]|nr:extracellular solute-binding protein [Gammaproteobacteria bacterium]